MRWPGAISMRDCDLTGATACGGEKHWVNLKVFGFTLASLVFTGFQAPLIAKYLPQEDANES